MAKKKTKVVSEVQSIIEDVINKDKAEEAKKIKNLRTAISAYEKNAGIMT